ncbi:MAG: hypothetical protein IT480_18315 [Gammaproteobacteria bacterium]|nr:hypothetical protein [Gammaproteobacteria bacterium]
MNDNLISRREALAVAGGAAMAVLLPGGGQAAEPAGRPARSALTIFARHLNWAGVEEAIEVAAAAGFGGIAWTVRKGAHIEPQNVARDLRRAVELSHLAGLSTTHIVTALNDADSPDAEAIVETVAGLGICRYRMQTARYNYSADVPAQLETLKRKLAGLERLTNQYVSIFGYAAAA